MRGLVNVHYGHALAHLKLHGKCEAAAVITVGELDDIQEYFWVLVTVLMCANFAINGNNIYRKIIVKTKQ
jgi:hypothetical protein